MIWTKNPSMKIPKPSKCKNIPKIKYFKASSGFTHPVTKAAPWIKTNCLKNWECFFLEEGGGEQNLQKTLF